MHKDLNTMFTEEDWFIIYSALALMKLDEDTEKFPKAAEKINTTMKKVHELIDDTDSAVRVVDLVLIANWCCR